MVKQNVYLVLTDLHYAVQKEHRINYMSEVLHILNEVAVISDSYKSRGYDVYLILLGDVIDASMRNPNDAMRCQSLFQFYSTLFSSVYCVVGNHEITYSNSNPFWFLVSSIEDENLKRLYKPLQPQGLTAVFNVPDVVVDGNVSFYFNHYGTPPKLPSSDGVAIGLFHQNIGSPDICKMWGSYTNVEEASFIKSYDYSFFGHMHLACGEYSLSNNGDCICTWLGSCVGTNVNEVESLPSELLLPAVLVENGNFISIERHKIVRKNPKECIDYEKLSITRTLNEEISQIKNLKVRESRASTLYDRVAESSGEFEELLLLLLKPWDELERLYKQGFESEFLEE